MCLHLRLIMPPLTGFVVHSMAGSDIESVSVSNLE